MKKTIIIWVISLLVPSCSNNSDNDSASAEVMNAVQGKWQFEADLYASETGYVHPVENGYSMLFMADGTFSSDIYADYNATHGTHYEGGHYTINSNNIITFTYQSKNEDDITVKLRITDYTATKLDLSQDLTGEMCIEGCGIRFKKIVDAKK